MLQGSKRNRNSGRHRDLNLSLSCCSSLGPFSVAADSSCRCCCTQVHKYNRKRRPPQQGRPTKKREAKPGSFEMPRNNADSVYRNQQHNQSPTIYPFPVKNATTGKKPSETNCSTEGQQQEQETHTQKKTQKKTRKKRPERDLSERFFSPLASMKKSENPTGATPSRLAPLGG